MSAGAAEQRIAYPDDPLMAVFWASALKVAIADPDAIAAFEEHTGRPFLLGRPRTGLDRLIDEATGADRAAVESFVAWFNEHVWGEDPFAPEEESDADRS